jgi:hypothetical protein
MTLHNFDTKFLSKWYHFYTKQGVYVRFIPKRYKKGINNYK